MFSKYTKLNYLLATNHILLLVFIWQGKHFRNQIGAEEQQYILNIEEFEYEVILKTVYFYINPESPIIYFIIPELYLYLFCAIDLVQRRH